MCGIFGFTNQISDKMDFLKKMGELQKHRGPDGEGYYVDENVALGMKRLSIIDLEHGGQPFFGRDKSVVVFCNGEIYNYKELRKELESCGYNFISHSDVEVIPYLYEKYGAEFVKKLNGMFGIVIYDKKTNSICLFRDRLGIKPLYYTVKDGNLIFSSELKSILSMDSVKKEIDYNALSTYLQLMYIPRPMTPFKNIYKLDSGSYMLWENKTSKIVKYWDISLKKNEITSEKQCEEEIEKLLFDSVKLELNSDVPVGSLLSGGVDSSIITALAAKITGKGFSTFHMRWKEVDGKTDESSFAHMVSEQYKTNETLRDVSQIDLIGLLPKLVWHLEEPFGDAAFVPTYLLSKIASEKVKVMLSGAGGDELFGGYGHYRGYSSIKSIIKLLIYGKNPAFSNYDMLRNNFDPLWKKSFKWFVPNTFKSSFEKNYLINRKNDKLNALMLSDIMYYLQDNILFLTDKMTMATSLECRVPFLDHRLVELAQKIPSGFKIKNKESKYILKKLSERYLPKEVLYRKKEGFGAPVWLWVNKYKDKYFDKLLNNGYLATNGLIDKKELNKLTAKKIYEKSESWYYWQVLILEIWFQIFIECKKTDNVFN